MGNRLAPYPGQEFEPFKDNQYNPRRISVQDNLKVPVVDSRSVSRFNLNENRAHNPHESPFNAATYSRYESSP
jgi:hypothetical protein